MNLAAIMHRPTLDYVYPSDRNKLSIQVQTAKDDFKSVKLVWWFRCDTDLKDLRVIQMNRTLQDGYSDYYRNIIDTKVIAAYVRYYFVFESEKEIVSLGAKGFIKGEPKFNANFFEFLWPNSNDGYKAPDWSDSLIYYQIFPERFNNANNNLTPLDAMPWGSKPTRENFMGGDLEGIINKLDYIRDLGVDCIYLTPIFNAPSNHKYDTIDYFEINPSFGNKDDLRRLVNEVHSRGMKILLDGVFNHSGYYFPKFQDVVEKGESSEYKDWFFVSNYPVSLGERNYDCVGHYKWMPKINLENKDAADYFVSVGEYWIREFDIDGWRLDVADEVSASFWTKFRNHIKQIKPDALLLGETWGDAGKLVTANRLDTAMNYLFKDAVVEWIAKENINVSGFNHLINKMYSLYPSEVIKRLYNPLDSHDTTRFLRETKDDISKFKLAIALQMTLPGSPAIFYGDEIGLSGDNDPGCRLCMEWNEDKQNKELKSWYKKLISIRKNNEALSKGEYKTLICDDENNIYGFERYTEDQTAIVIINAGSKDIDLPIKNSGWEDLLNDSYITENADSNLTRVSADSVHIYKKQGGKVNEN